ncbi:MAG: phenylacetate--CoA ligase [Actinobacteria bacterium]|nr:phenylacetate--CoA ligase [Actinomycetota bacterium]
MFEPGLETMDRGALDELQSARLREMVARVYQRVPPMRERLEDASIRPSDIQGISDLHKLPFTRKTDLRDNYPFGLFAVDTKELARIHASSGTTGKPTVVGYTRADLDLFAAMCARALAASGAGPGMILHNAYGYGLFTGGLGFHAGGERLGMVVVPASAGMTERQVMLMRDFHAQVLACTPSYALTIAAEFARQGMSPEEAPIQYAILGAEPWTETMRAEIDSSLGAKSVNVYGLSEIIGPGVSYECVEARSGSHINEDHFLAEVVDRDTGEQLPIGEEGVLVITTLTKEALPLIRYWTGDITSLDRSRCSCGRSSARMSMVKGRTDDMLIVRGINVYPSQVEAAFGGVDGLTPYYRLLVDRTGILDELEVEVELSEDVFRRVAAEFLSDEIVEADHLLRRVRDMTQRAIRENVGVSAKVTLLEPGRLPRSEGGKAQRVVDRRQLL